MKLGVLMLKTDFVRVLGDIGNPATFHYPVEHRVVPQATPRRVIEGQARGLLDAFIEAGHALVAEGCTALTTTCGFLALHQHTLASALPVPFAASALLQIGQAAQALSAGAHVTVLTIRADQLTPAHLQACGAPGDTPIEGVPRESHFARAVLDESVPLDATRCAQDLLAAAHAARLRYPHTGAWVLECANMPPYATALRLAHGLPVWDALTLSDALMANSPRDPAPPCASALARTVESAS
jgi:hypothetical protein